MDIKKLNEKLKRFINYSLLEEELDKMSDDEIIKYYKDDLDSFLNDYYFDNSDWYPNYTDEDYQFIKNHSKELFDLFVNELNYYNEWVASENAADKLFNKYNIVLNEINKPISTSDALDRWEKKQDEKHDEEINQLKSNIIEKINNLQNENTLIEIKKLLDKES